MKKPSNNLISAAHAVVVCMAHVETLRPKIEAIQQDLLDLCLIDPRWTDTDRVLTPKTSYLMRDEDADWYYAELDKAYRAAGFTEITTGQCPLLIAENLLRDAERLFMEASIELTAKAGFTVEMIEDVITCSGYNGLETRKKYLDLNLSYVVPFIPQPIIK